MYLHGTPGSRHVDKRTVIDIIKSAVFRIYQCMMEELGVFNKDIWNMPIYMEEI
jgi:hypothetical protein